MTKPTQAQIEAAATAMRNMALGLLSLHKSDNWIDLAQAALTAAAEEGSAMTKPTPTLRTSVWPDMPTKKEIESATIERCAQIAESRMRNEPASIINSMCEEIAAAIRALKDKS